MSSALYPARVNVRVYSARGLRLQDGSQGVFVVISCGKERFHTDTSADRLEPSWNEECQLVVNKADELQIKVKTAEGTTLGMVVEPLSCLRGDPSGKLVTPLLAKGGADTVKVQYCTNRAPRPMCPYDPTRSFRLAVLKNNRPWVDEIVWRGATLFRGFQLTADGIMPSNVVKAAIGHIHKEQRVYKFEKTSRGWRLQLQEGDSLSDFEQ